MQQMSSLRGGDVAHLPRFAVWGWLLFAGALVVGRERDYGFERDFDTYYGMGGLGYSRDLYGAKDFYGRETIDGDKKDGGDDECSRIESNGIPLADALREAAEVLAVQGLENRPPQALQLVDFFVSEKDRRFLLSNCPQAVVLAYLLQVQFGSNNHTEKATEGLSDLLVIAPTLRAAYRPPPQWTGAPWEEPLNAAQQRTGIVLFPIGEQQFQVEQIDSTAWSINPRRRCAGRRDLGNLQATPLTKCLAKCTAHPRCRSAVFWHWQPGGFGFEQRCFLSSTCTTSLATSEGAEGAVLFEKIGASEPAAHVAQKGSVSAQRQAAPWAPRCGHHMLVSMAARAGVPSAGGSYQQRRLWVLGGIGVDPFANTTKAKVSNADESSKDSTQFGADGRGYRTGFAGGFSGTSSGTSGTGLRSGSKKATSGDVSSNSKLSGRRRKDADASKDTDSTKKTGDSGRRKSRHHEKNRTAAGDVIEAYLSRHVELNGELPPLRSLPYGRLGDVWQSDDMGATWTPVSSRSPWGPRAFFGAVAPLNGRSLVVFGGVRTPAVTDLVVATKESTLTGGLQREYMHDVWLADVNLDNGMLTWHQLEPAQWTARAGFQAALRKVPDSWTSGAKEEIIVLGGRLATGTVTNDVWVASVDENGRPSPEWHQLTTAAGWVARADFAAVARGDGDIWVMGGCDAGGQALSDVWRSTDGRSWNMLVEVSPWGPRIGLVAAASGVVHNASSGVVAVYGGYAYVDREFTALPSEEADKMPEWAQAAWVSQDGKRWDPVNVTQSAWMPVAMHARMLIHPCDDGKDLAVHGACAVVAGGLTHEGYYDNTVQQLQLPSWVPTAEPEAPTVSSNNTVNALSLFASSSSHLVLMAPLWTSPMQTFAVMAIAVWVCLSLCFVSTFPLLGNGNVNGKQHKRGLASVIKAPIASWCSLDPSTRCATGALVAACVLSISVAVGATAAVAQLSRELSGIRSEGPGTCRVDDEAIDQLKKALGLREADERNEQIDTLLRLAAREPQMGYGGYGGYSSYGGYYGSGGRGGDGYGKGSDRYGYGHGYDSFYGGGYGGYGYGDDSVDPDTGGVSTGAGSTAEDAAKLRERELASLQTTQGLTCRSPRCDRNATSCAAAAGRSLSSPHGCCSDYMLMMLTDVTEWLSRQGIPYFVTYGTLLGALREGDILPYTQDMDIVVDRAYWPQLQRGLEGAEFFGTRRYLFGVDQWEERVSRVCADWEGFATSTIGGADGDRLSRSTEFHLDVYSSDWWQITDLHLIDCVEPLGQNNLLIRGRNFSAPARPRACIEKLYGAEWRIPKHALSGVN